LVGDSEYISAQSVKPIKKVEYPSSLEAMLQIGINVYFVDRKTFKEFRKFGCNGALFLERLQSENQKRGKT
ncbi:MAG: hypothetical protein M1514_00455, partial [Patescibacteria group bacterium]|nr:hypothetical protein [Patescibacteria group bacterium]